jgi:hypothetical protein
MVTSGLSLAGLGTVGYSLWPRLNRYNEEVARQRHLLSADPDLEDFVRMASLAANSHNTQPWKFRLDDDRVIVLPDFARRTDIVDPDNHHLYIGLGCATENLIIAAKANGRSAEPSIETGSETTINISLKSGPVEDTPLYEAIPFRQSTRSEYDGQPISASDISLLEAAAQEDGVSVLIFTESSDREAILEFVVEGNNAQMDDPAFVAELLDWIKFTPDQALETHDGLFIATSGNPVVPAWLAERMFDTFFQTDSENDKYSNQIRSSAGIAVFLGDKEDPEHWIKVGRSFQRFALQSTTLGIRNAHVNQPIEVPAVRPEFANWLGLPGSRPDLIVRFGRAPALPMSLRRPVAEIMV